jgi:predicted phosphodiesterase
MEFILHTGDIVSSGGEQDDWNRYFEDIENATLENATFYYAVGNHERYTYANGPGDWGDPDENYSTYLANVELPGNERYYSFDYLNQIHFVFINTEEEWNSSTHSFEITTAQYDWLINDLEQNEIDIVVAAYHRPSYSIRDSGRVHDAQEVRSVLEPIFLEYGIDLVFSGHDHYYYHTVRNGITYVTTGGAGADLYSNGDVSEWQIGDVYFSEFHYCNITVSEINGKVTLGIDVLIFNENDKTTSLGDSFIVNNVVSQDTTTSKTTESSTTSSSTDLPSDSTTTQTTTSQKTTPFSYWLIIGIAVAYYRKRHR